MFLENCDKVFCEKFLKNLKNIQIGGGPKVSWQPDIPFGDRRAKTADKDGDIGSRDRPTRGNTRRGRGGWNRGSSKIRPNGELYRQMGERRPKSNKRYFLKGEENGGNQNLME